MLRRFLRSRFFIAVVVVAVIAAAWETYLTVRVGSVVDAAVTAETRTSSSLRIDVRLPFPPEQFHTLFLQSYGRISGVDGETVHLRDVRPESVGMLARIYWIEQILPGRAA